MLAKSNAQCKYLEFFVTCDISDYEEGGALALDLGAIHGNFNLHHASPVSIRNHAGI